MRVEQPKDSEHKVVAVNDSKNFPPDFSSLGWESRCHACDQACCKSKLCCTAAEHKLAPAAEASVAGAAAEAGGPATTAGLAAAGTCATCSAAKIRGSDPRGGARAEAAPTSGAAQKGTGGGRWGMVAGSPAIACGHTLQ